jgi:hypothetical protein
MTPARADLVAGAWSTTGHPMSRQTYDMLVMDPSTRELVLLTYSAPGTDCIAWPADGPDLDAVPGRIAHYDPGARTWRFTSTPANAWAYDSAAEHDPVSGLVLVLSSAGLWTYDPRTGEVTRRLTLENQPRLGYAAELVHFPPTGAFYLFTRDGLVFEVLPDRTRWEATRIVEVTDATGAPPPEAKGWAYDSRRERIAGGLRDGIWSTFDPRSRAWSRVPVPGDPGSLAFFTLVYDDIDDVFVFFTDYTSGWETWLYRP